MMTSAPAGATDQNIYRISNSTPCCWRSSRYSSRNVRGRWCSSWFANVTPDSNPLRLTHRECSVTFLPRKTTEAPGPHGPIVRKRTSIRAVHRRGNAWLVVPPSNEPGRGNTTHGLRHTTKGEHNTTHESMQIATPHKCNDRRMILGSKNPMVMQAEMARWQGWDFPPPLPRRNA